MSSTLTNIVDWLKSWFYTETEVDTLLATKQDQLISGVNIKTVNNSSLLGEGNIIIEGGGSSVDIVSGWDAEPTDDVVPSEKLVKDSLDLKQDLLVSGTTIKTVNNNSLLGSGNIEIQGGGGSVIGTGSFSINSSGHLIVELPNGVDNPYFINGNGHLVYDTSNTYNGE